MYFERIQTELPDLRDNRGKVHNQSFVLTGLLLGIMSGKQKISELHRYLVNHFERLQEWLEFEAVRPISDPQLRRLLNQLDWKKYNEVNSSCFGISADYSSEDWISIDGKELKGSIEKLNPDERCTRGEVLLNVIRHKDSRMVVQDFYRGDKNSERDSVIKLLKDKGLSNGSITLDALHCIAGTTNMINKNGGRYIVQLKKNQKNLVKQMEAIEEEEMSNFKVDQIDLSHGRLTRRSYSFYKIKNLEYAQRWKGSGFESMIKVGREMYHQKSKKIQTEKAFYLSNVEVESQGKANELAQGVRGHWSVEADHYLRDVTFGEDQIRTPKGNVSRILASIRTWAIQLLRMTKVKNIKAQMQLFADCPNQLYKYLINMDLQT